MNLIPAQTAAANNDAQSLFFDAIGDVGDPIEMIDRSIKTGLSGELYLVGDKFRSKVCLYEGKMAWAFCSTHAEHLGGVLQRVVGLDGELLRSAMRRAAQQQRMLGEWLVQEQLLTQVQLRRCLRAHLGAHLRALSATSGEYEVAFAESRYRYDPGLTFHLDEVICDSVFARICEPLSVADVIAVVDPADRSVVGIAEHGDRSVARQLADCASRAQQFAISTGMAPQTTTLSMENGTCCVVPLSLHLRLYFGAFVRTRSKIGLLVQRALQLAGTV